MGEVEPQSRGDHLLFYAERLRASSDDYARVCARLDPGTREFLELAPPGASWVPLRFNVDFFAAVDAELGTDRVRAISYDAVRDAIFPSLRPVVEVALAAFGVSPSTLFSLGDSLMRFRLRGQSLVYRPGSDTSGTIEIHVRGLHPSRPFFEAWAGIATYVYDLCRTQGAVHVASIEPHGADLVGELRAVWR